MLNDFGTVQLLAKVFLNSTKSKGKVGKVVIVGFCATVLETAPRS